MKRDSQLLQRIVKVAVEISSPVVEKLADDIDRLPDVFGQPEILAMCEAIAQPDNREAVASLLQCWRQDGRDASAKQVAAALRAACATDAIHRTRQRLEMVWSGPCPGTSTYRRTDQALLELIHGAKQTVVVVTFAAYKVPQIARALVDAARRGVKVVLILESTEDSNGAVSFNPLEALGDELARAAVVYMWAMSKRAVDDRGNRGALHVKCAVADSQVALISSANLTDHAMNLNMELGLLVQGGDLPGTLADHLQSLIQARILTTVAKNKPQKHYGPQHQH